MTWGVHLQVVMATLWSLTTMAIPPPTGQNIVKPDDPSTISILMPGVTTKEEDEYWCTAIPVQDKEFYITSFEALPDRDHTHHLMVFTCSGLSINKRKWSCGSECRDAKIMFAWAHHADPTQLPKDVGFRINKDDVTHIQLQVHYKSVIRASTPDHTGIKLTVSQQRPRYIAGIMILAATSAEVIPPHKKKHHIDVSCPAPNVAPIYPFAFRVHAHTMARVITGYHHNTSWHLLGKGNPQWPQAFYPMKKSIEVKTGDHLFARCTYSSMDHDTGVRMGGSHHDEMCNFYMMYYTDPDRGEPYHECVGNAFPKEFAHVPEGSDVPPPPNPLLEDVANGNIQGIEEVSDWLTGAPKLGQVAGVATDKSGNVHVFHRGKRVWDASSFDSVDNTFKGKDAVAEKTLLTFDSSGKLLDQWGDNKFYMPHGLHVDRHNNIWLTDVALHQVMRFPAGDHEPDLVLGERMVPGVDNIHFCKPTGVATLRNGQFFVSDGYCNHRIIKYSADGKVLKEWGTASSSLAGDGFAPPSTFTNPHSISVNEAEGMLCVADRENRRIQCFDLEGNFLNQMHSPDIQGPVYAVAFNPISGVLYAVNGADNYKDKFPIEGFTFDARHGELKQTWSPKSDTLRRPHDIAVSNDGKAIYVAEIGPNRIWKFNITRDEGIHLAQKKGGRPATVDNDMLNKADDDDSILQKVTESDHFGASLIIGGLLVIPVLIIVVVTIILRLKKNGLRQQQYHKVQQLDLDNDDLDTYRS